jgi:hypothetical protein
MQVCGVSVIVVYLCVVVVKVCMAGLVAVLAAMHDKYMWVIERPKHGALFELNAHT